MALLRVQRPVFIDGALFEAGREYDVSGDIAGHWLIQALVTDGLAKLEEPELEKAAKPKGKRGGDVDGDIEI